LKEASKVAVVTLVGRLFHARAGATVTFPDSERHRPWPVSICAAWWTESNVCRSLAWGRCV